MNRNGHFTGHGTKVVLEMSISRTAMVLRVVLKLGLATK
jgi:hypothetical protein